MKVTRPSLARSYCSDATGFGDIAAYTSVYNLCSFTSMSSSVGRVDLSI